MEATYFLKKTEIASCAWWCRIFTNSSSTQMTWRLLGLADLPIHTFSYAAFKAIYSKRILLLNSTDLLKLKIQGTLTWSFKLGSNIMVQLDSQHMISHCYLLFIYSFSAPLRDISPKNVNGLDLDPSSSLKVKYDVTVRLLLVTFIFKLFIRGYKWLWPGLHATNNHRNPNDLDFDLFMSLNPKSADALRLSTNGLTWLSYEVKAIPDFGHSRSPHSQMYLFHCTAPI